MIDLRPELPELTERIAMLPRHRGYPVPWFVAWVDPDGKPVERGEGEPDFRILHANARALAWNNKRCWICGDPLGTYRTFVVGPMCAVNRTSAEPPAHLDCSTWSAIACPFLSRPHARRRETGIPEGTVEPDGIMLRRNPGVALVWTTKTPRIRRIPDGVLFDIGDPEHVEWYAEGRTATREEVVASIKSGLPSLIELATAQGPSAVRELNRLSDRAMRLVPSG